MKHPLGLTLLALPLLPACAGLSEAPRGEEPMTNDDALVVYCAGLDALLADPRDEGLRRALSMADDRLLELPEELGEEPDVPLEVFRVLADVLAAPMSLQVDPIEGGDWSQGPQVNAQLTVRGSDDEVQSMHGRISELLGMVLPAPTTPDESFGGLQRLETPGGNAYFGVPAGDDPRFVAAWGEPDLGALGLGSLDLPAGTKPLLAFKLDMAKVAPILESFLGMAGPEADLVKKQLEMVGLLGGEPMFVTAAAARREGRIWVSSRYGNWKPMAAKMGALVTEPLTREEIGMIPADATYAVVSKIAFSSILGSMESMTEGEVDIPGMVKAMVGLDLQEDLFDNLGTTFGLYTSKTTGGGGLASMVAYAAVTDPGGMAETVELLVDLANSLATKEARGYVRIRDWWHGEDTCYTLTFPGLPVPFEFSFALTDDWFFAAATPQALVAGLDHAATGGAGLAGAARFREVATGSLDDLNSLTYADSVAAMESGYGMAGLFFSALANGVRSPKDPAREPGLVMPSFDDLFEGACASVMLTRIEGEDLVSTGQSDGSVVAGTAAFLGSSFGKMMLVGLGAVAFLVPTMATTGMVELPAELAQPPEEIFEEF